MGKNKEPHFFVEDDVIARDAVGSMDLSYEELSLKLQPVFHDKIKYVSGKLLKDCFKLIGNIINSHQVLRENYVTPSVQEAKLGGKDDN